MEDQRYEELKQKYAGVFKKMEKDLKKACEPLEFLSEAAKREFDKAMKNYVQKKETTGKSQDN